MIQSEVIRESLIRDLDIEYAFMFNDMFNNIRNKKTYCTINFEIIQKLVPFSIFCCLYLFQRYLLVDLEVHGQLGVVALDDLTRSALDGLRSNATHG